MGLYRTGHLAPARKPDSAGSRPIGGQWCLLMPTMACCGMDHEGTEPDQFGVWVRTTEPPICSTLLQMEPDLQCVFGQIGKTRKRRCRLVRQIGASRHSVPSRRQPTTKLLSASQAMVCCFAPRVMESHPIPKCPWPLGTFSANTLAISCPTAPADTPSELLPLTQKGRPADAQCGYHAQERRVRAEPAGDTSHASVVSN